SDPERSLLGLEGHKFQSVADGAGRGQEFTSVGSFPRDLQRAAGSSFATPKGLAILGQGRKGSSDDPSLQAAILLAKPAQAPVDARHRRLVEEIPNLLPRACPEMTFGGPRREYWYIAVLQILALGAYHFCQIGATFDGHPEPIEQLVPIKSVAQDVRMEAL